jgi:hypothetical protein
MDDDHHLVVDPTAVKQLQDDLYQRMQLMLPVAAAVMTADPPYKQGEPWSLVHSACLVSCPAAMLHIALKWNPQRHAVRSKDLRAGRYPLHCAANGTRLTYPLASLGKFKSSRGLSCSRLPLFPEVCRATDAEKHAAALPLHGEMESRHNLNRRPTTLMLREQSSTRTGIPLSGRPERRDGKRNSSLATSSGRPWSSLTTIYGLLRRQPTFDAGSRVRGLLKLWVSD